MIAKSYLLEKNENTAFSLRLTFPNTWGSCQMWCLLQTSSLSKTQGFVKHLFIYLSLSSRNIWKSQTAKMENLSSLQNKKNLWLKCVQFTLQVQWCIPDFSMCNCGRQNMCWIKFCTDSVAHFKCAVKKRKQKCY